MIWTDDIPDPEPIDFITFELDPAAIEDLLDRLAAFEEVEA